MAKKPKNESDNKSNNRIAKFFDDYDKKLKNIGKPASPNVFNHVEFEKFDPTIIQNVVQSSEDESEFQYEEPKNTAKTIIVSQDSQLLQTSNLWVANCDVRLRKDFVRILSELEGVESLNFISRYRFRVGIGKLFDENTVKNNIAKIIDEYFEAYNKTNS